MIEPHWIVWGIASYFYIGLATCYFMREPDPNGGALMIAWVWPVIWAAMALILFICLPVIVMEKPRDKS